LQRLVKQKALEIALDLGLKFKATKKWLTSFVKRCELLGYINYVDTVDQNGISLEYNKIKSASPFKTSPINLVSCLCSLFFENYD